MAVVPNKLTQQRPQLTKRCDQLERHIQRLSGRTFKLTSPQDMSDVLFSHLKIPVPPNARRGAHGYYSTNRESLEVRHHHTFHTATSVHMHHHDCTFIVALFQYQRGALFRYTIHTFHSALCECWPKCESHTHIGPTDCTVDSHSMSIHQFTCVYCTVLCMLCCAVQEIADSHPVVSYILEWRKCNKLLQELDSNWDMMRTQARILGLGQTWTDEALRLRGTFLQTGTVSGRMAMDNPNLQTLPKPAEYQIEDSQQVQVKEAGGHQVVLERQVNIRTAFVPAPDHVILAVDYRQVGHVDCKLGCSLHGVDYEQMTIMRHGCLLYLDNTCQHDVGRYLNVNSSFHKPARTVV